VQTVTGPPRIECGEMKQTIVIPSLPLQATSMEPPPIIDTEPLGCVLVNALCCAYGANSFDSTSCGDLPTLPIQTVEQQRAIMEPPTLASSDLPAGVLQDALPCVNGVNPFVLHNDIVVRNDDVLGTFGAICETVVPNSDHIPGINSGTSSGGDHGSSSEETGLHDTSTRQFRDPSLWKNNVAKRLRNTGQQYTNRHGVPKRERLMKSGYGLNCRKKCHSKICGEDRQGLFHGFWQQGSLTAQRCHLSKFVKKGKPKNGTKRKLVAVFIFSECGEYKCL